MGQAKQRGTFEQRVEQSRVKWEQGIEVTKKEIQEMEALEQRQLDALGRFVNNQVLPHMERQHGALMRADFSLVDMPVTKMSQEQAMAEALKKAAKSV